ncbi:helix-turn-helix transcriptional regulator [Thermococcus sp.]
MKKGLIFIMFMLVFFNMVSAQFTMSSVTLTVYDDGYVKVGYKLIPSEYAAQLELPLLGKHYENFFVEDENGNPLNFQVENGSILIYPGNAQIIRVFYYTPDLTSKEGLVWTLNISLNYSFTVVLPNNSVVVDLSDIPLSIAQNRITMPPGNQGISYVLSYTQTPSKGDHEERYLLFGLLGILAVTGVFLGYRLKKGEKKRLKLSRPEFMERLDGLDLNDEERRALLYIFDKGGKASQAEVREALGIPKTTAWRMFKRLEKKGLVKILKGRKENWVELNL